MVKNGPGAIFEELMTENFPQLLKEIKLYIPEALQTPSKINTPPHSQIHHNKSVSVEKKKAKGPKES